MTCWRRLAAWNEAGVWDQLHALVLKRLRSKNQLDRSRAVIDSSHVRAARRGPKAAPARLTPLPVAVALPGISATLAAAAALPSSHHRFTIHSFVARYGVRTRTPRSSDAAAADHIKCRIGDATICGVAQTPPRDAPA